MDKNGAKTMKIVENCKIATRKLTLIGDGDDVGDDGGVVDCVVV